MDLRHQHDKRFVITTNNKYVRTQTEANDPILQLIGTGFWFLVEQSA